MILPPMETSSFMRFRMICTIVFAEGACQFGYVSAYILEAAKYRYDIVRELESHQHTRLADHFSYLYIILNNIITDSK